MNEFNLIFNIKPSINFIRTWRFWVIGDKREGEKKSDVTYDIINNKDLEL